jgi:hypothetical protein
LLEDAGKSSTTTATNIKMPEPTKAWYILILYEDIVYRRCRRWYCRLWIYMRDVGHIKH